MQEWLLEMFVDRSGAAAGGTAALLVLVAAIAVVAMMGWRGRSPVNDAARLGRIGLRVPARPRRALIARRWAIGIAAAAGLLLGAAIGAPLGWLETVEGGAIGVIFGALCGAGNPALSQLDEVEDTLAQPRENGRGPA
ncbi:MAG TPA: hypothetical protein VML75_15160 [Kofleriaceae bacterium]|nr:hypothetical protein [Kofleriaceae bacterium]